MDQTPNKFWFGISDHKYDSTLLTCGIFNSNLVKWTVNKVIRIKRIFIISMKILKDFPFTIRSLTFIQYRYI